MNPVYLFWKAIKSRVGTKTRSVGLAETRLFFRHYNLTNPFFFSENGLFSFVSDDSYYSLFQL